MWNLSVVYRLWLLVKMNTGKVCHVCTLHMFECPFNLLKTWETTESVRRRHSEWEYVCVYVCERKKFVQNITTGDVKLWVPMIETAESVRSPWN